MTTPLPLPYFEPFDYGDHSLWPVEWAMPGPDGMTGDVNTTASVLGGRGVIQLSQDWFNGTPQFSARLPIANAARFDLKFTFDMHEVVPLLTGNSDPTFEFRVQLEDQALGVVFYDIYMDNFDGLQAEMYKWQQMEGFPDGYIQARGIGLALLSEIDPLQPMSVRILENDTVRSFKVWQGAEPVSWTLVDTSGTAPVHSGSRNIDLMAFSQQNGTPKIYLDAIGVNHEEEFVSVGVTEHFEFFYDTALGAPGLADATAAMALAEGDLLNHFAWFGKTAPWSNGPARLPIKFISPQNNTVSGALAYYEGYDEGIYFIWDKANGSAINPGYRGMFVHEVAHHFQSLQGGRWGNAATVLEAQATFLDREFRRSIGDFDSLTSGGYADRVPYWINSYDRLDFVNHVVLDQLSPFDYAVGCTLLFFNYLRWHRGYSPAAITQHPGTTMRAAYQSLTGDPIDPFPPFLDGIDTAFPRETQVSPFAVLAWPSKDIANPYPLPGTTDPVQPGGGALASLYGVIGSALTAQIRQSWHRR